MREYDCSRSVEKLCGLFGKTRQAYYDQVWRQDSHHVADHFIVEKVLDIRQAQPGAGVRALHEVLKKELSGHHLLVGRDRLRTILQSHRLMLKRKRTYVRTTDSNHMYRKWPSLVAGLTVEGPSQLWVSDITYLRTVQGFNYLSLITDAYSRKIVGYHLSQHLKAQGAVAALRKAIKSLNGTSKGLIHHSDRGIQYCCQEYVDVLLDSEILISMTETGSPYENAMAERVNGILKTQMGLGKTFSGYKEAVKAVHEAIDAYNRLRPHMSCNYLTPNVAHQQTGILPKKWKPSHKQNLSLQL